MALVVMSRRRYDSMSYPGWGRERDKRGVSDSWMRVAAFSGLLRASAGEECAVWTAKGSVVPYVGTAIWRAANPRLRDREG